MLIRNLFWNLSDQNALEPKKMSKGSVQEVSFLHTECGMKTGLLGNFVFRIDIKKYFMWKVFFSTLSAMKVYHILF